MAKLVRVVARLKRVTGIPKDDCINTFHFYAGDVDPSTYGPSIATVLHTFYDTTPSTGTHPVSYYLGAGIKTTGGLDLQMREVEPTTGVQTGITYDAVQNLSARGSTNELPFDCAAVLSFHASLTGVREIVAEPPTGPAGDQHPRARRRGRIYLGPLNILAKDGTYGIINQGTFGADLILAAEGLMAQAAAASVPWQVYSRKDGVARQVVGGFLDNAFDTQRRRDLPSSLTVQWP